ncbi:MAG: hypothetical protein E7363_03035 [Clostridiales bacterium]|nr:hypothetical protein [Clostridiales bacterium]
MKETYLNLMEKTLSAYTNEHILHYFERVKENGLTEHGFPRLTANIGILIAHGKRVDLLPLFTEMMEFCCKTMPTVDAANDFSVREIICCLLEVESSGVVEKETTQRWRTYLKEINPLTTYTIIAKSPTDTVKNWALFSGVSEFFRQTAGLCSSSDFIDLQIEQQLQWLDENGMYQDHPNSEIHHPVLYDLVSRGLFTLLLHQGYRGKFYDRISEALKKAALCTLSMQSPNGEIAYGGRSNQFLFNEPWMIAIFEFEANRYAMLGDMQTASRFKQASARALAVTERWLNAKPIRHVKNRFPTESGYGCEEYAYFDKYMITVASNLYAAYLVCNQDIPCENGADLLPCAWQSSPHFHKLFLKSGGYGLEFDFNADACYDANGLGRVHRTGAPSAICLSCPCPVRPAYRLDIKKPFSFALCSADRSGEDWLLGAEKGTQYQVLESGTNHNFAFATIACRLSNGKRITERYTVSEKGVTITLSGTDNLFYTLPAFAFDGEKESEITIAANTLTVTYQGYACQYMVSGSILDTGKTAANRNGHYRAFMATAKENLTVSIEIFQVEVGEN